MARPLSSLKLSSAWMTLVARFRGDYEPRRRAQGPLLNLSCRAKTGATRLARSSPALPATRFASMDPFSVLPLTLFGGQYRVIRPLGQGGMGSVYEVEQVSTGARRALKVLHRHLLADQKLVARFVQEARIGANIPSDHVVSVLDAGVDETTGRPYLVMELLMGQGLDAVLADTPRLGSADVLEIVRQLCHALGSAHAGGIVHRDVKPSNVFLCESRSAGGVFTVKVLDFGIAKLTSDTQSTQAIGTPKWMAPEQAYATDVTPAADIWPLGLLVFRMLTGASYWRGSNAVALMRESLLDEVFTATARAAELGCEDALPPGFEAWFQTCLARAPEDRYANASLAFEALCPLLEQVSEGKLPELVIHARPVTLRPSYGIPTSPLLPPGASWARRPAERKRCDRDPAWAVPRAQAPTGCGGHGGLPVGCFDARRPGARGLCSSRG